MSEIGDNSKELLKSIADRIVEREEEKRQAAEDIKELYAEAKSAGLIVPALRKTIKRRLKTQEQVAKEEEIDAVADTYALALGMIGS